jgi:glycine oxidase
MAESERVDVVVVGAGIIGLSIAWLARRRGLSVIVLERGEVGWGASQVAAGMLAPVAEAEYGDAAASLLELGLRSAELWPQYAALLERDSGSEVGLMRSGTLLVARDEDEARELDRQLALQRSLGLTVERLRGSEARAREPGLAPNVRLALELAGDHSVDPRRVLAALRAACETAGVDVREHAALARVQLDDGRLAGAALAGGELVRAASLVLAAGAWSGDIDGLPAGECMPVRPVKGQVMRLRDPAGPGLLQRVLRFHGGYLVPRADGRYVLGATVEERGLELGATAGGVYELLRDARELVPGVLELEIEELATGLRPGTPDNVPVIGPGTIPGLIWASGHHRNGILLAPVTALLVAHLLELPGPELAPLERGTAERLLASCSPRRFAPAAPQAGASRPTHEVGAGR